MSFASRAISRLLNCCSNPFEGLAAEILPPILRTQNGPLDDIVRFVGEPARTSLICRAFLESTRKSGVYKEVLLSWVKEDRSYAIFMEREIRQHLAQFPGIPPSLTLDNCAALTDEKCGDLVKRFEKEIRVLKDTNLIRFFDRLCLLIPSEARPNPPADGNIHQTAAVIRTWMNNRENEEVLKTIRFLNFSMAELTILPPEIARLPNLLELDLSLNLLTALPSEINGLGQLQEMDLHSNKLTELPEIEGLVNLCKLNLSINKLARLPNSIGRLVKLQVLNLASNRLRTLPPTCVWLVNLLELDLFNNKLKTLPIVITYLRTLQKLDLGINELKALPGALARLVNLRSLEVSSNQFSVVPDVIVELIGLQELDLGFNCFDTLPEAFIQLQNLIKLNLSYNQLALLPASLALLESLQELELVGNEFEDEVITQLAHLESLDLRIPAE